jgi:aldehyde dehydrogenase (NAD+)
MKPKKVGTPLVLFGTRSEVRYEPKGLVLVLAPWNYPFQLLMVPVATAIAAGNCVMIKASSKVPNTAKFIKDFLDKLFDEDEVAVIEGGAEVADAMLEMPFNHIFFTGSPPVGKKIMGFAAKQLAPVTLELGGKSPVIVDETADIKKAAERVMWGKFINAGQTCVAPDYMMVHESREKELIQECKKVITERFGATKENLETSTDFCRLVSRGHFDGLKKVLDESVSQGAHIEFGGFTHAEERYIAPTLLANVTPDTAIMKDEIFGPIMPILKYKKLDECFNLIRSKEKPLALYIFSTNQAAIEQILSGTTSGGSCVNSLIIHLANHNLPFGGVGFSGMGNYHGIYGFKALSHERAVLHQGSIDMLKYFYPPYTKGVKRMIELALKHLI